jgi:hypothetical protein
METSDSSFCGSINVGDAVANFNNFDQDHDHDAGKVGELSSDIDNIVAVASAHTRNSSFGAYSFLPEPRMSVTPKLHDAMSVGTEDDHASFSRGGRASPGSGLGGPGSSAQKMDALQHQLSMALAEMAHYKLELTTATRVQDALESQTKSLAKENKTLLHDIHEVVDQYTELEDENKQAQKENRMLQRKLHKVTQERNDATLKNRGATASSGRPRSGDGCREDYAVAAIDANKSKPAAASPSSLQREIAKDQRSTAGIRFVTGAGVIHGAASGRVISKSLIKVGGRGTKTRLHRATSAGDPVASQLKPSSPGKQRRSASVDLATVIGTGSTSTDEVNKDASEHRSAPMLDHTGARDEAAPGSTASSASPAPASATLNHSNDLNASSAPPITRSGRNHGAAAPPPLERLESMRLFLDDSIHQYFVSDETEVDKSMGEINYDHHDKHGGEYGHSFNSTDTGISGLTTRSCASVDSTNAKLFNQAAAILEEHFGFASSVVTDASVDVEEPTVPAARARGRRCRNPRPPRQEGQDREQPSVADETSTIGAVRAPPVPTSRKLVAGRRRFSRHVPVISADAIVALEGEQALLKAEVPKLTVSIPTLRRNTGSAATAFFEQSDGKNLFFDDSVVSGSIASPSLQHQSQRAACIASLQRTYNHQPAASVNSSATSSDSAASGVSNAVASSSTPQRQFIQFSLPVNARVIPTNVRRSMWGSRVFGKLPQQHNQQLNRAANNPISGGRTVGSAAISSATGTRRRSSSQNWLNIGSHKGTASLVQGLHQVFFITPV